jgi:hypothetical protein
MLRSGIEERRKRGGKNALAKKSRFGSYTVWFFLRLFHSQFIYMKLIWDSMDFASPGPSFGTCH